MNKLTKIGLSALCGSLASISAANAGSWMLQVQLWLRGLV